MFAKTYARKLTRRDWVLLSVFVIALAGIVVGYINNTNDTAGTNSIVERIKQDGTLAHPYADASQCPSSTDIVIWPEWSEHLSDHCIRHVWSCEACGYRFEDTVYLSRELADAS
jgi:hypothetical protein